MIIVLAALALLAVFLIFRSLVPGIGRPVSPKISQGQVINDTPIIPTSTQVTASEGEIVPRGQYDIKLQPRSEQEKVSVPQALLTLKQAYGLALPEAAKWSSDASLIFVRSLGALALDGKSSAWQAIYGSHQKGKGYEVIIQSDQITSQKEIKSALAGWPLPGNWYDSNEALSVLQNLASSGEETVSAISFYYSAPAKLWAYGLATGPGEKTTTIWVK